MLCKNKIPVVFTFDKSFMLPALVAVKSLLLSAKSDTFYDIFLLINNSVDKSNQETIVKNLAEFENKNIEFILMDEEYFNKFPSNQKWPKTVYYRLLIPELIKNYDKVIYSDVDVFFKQDMTNIYQTDIAEYYWGGVAAERNNEAVCHQNYAENSNEFIYMSGFMLMNLKKMRDCNITSQFVNTVERFSNRLKMFDLEVLNLSCDKIKALPFEYCVLENIYEDSTNAHEWPWLSKIYSLETIENARKNPAIIHYAGREDKIWTRCRMAIDKEYLAVLDSINFKLSCLQIGDNDLVGNKFNGHNLKLYLNERGINTSHIIPKNKKKSKDETTYYFDWNFSREPLDSNLFSNADIVHFHLIHNTNFALTSLPVYSALKPTVITLHDSYFTTGHCLHSFECEKWKTGCKDCPKLDIPFEREIDSSALEFKIKYDAIQNSNICAIVASDYMENLVKQSPIWKGKKIYKVPFGINQDIFKPVDKASAKKALGINENDFVFMLRAITSPFKGLEIIKNALRELKTDKKITIITVEKKKQLKEFKHKFNIKEYGWVYDDNKLVQLYQAADLFLMPSEQEAFGMMAIEAMSCKVPVISIKGTSLESVTNAPECGLCPEKKDFSAELNRIVNNEEELKLRAEKSYKYAKENYDKDVYVDRIIEVYKDVIKNHQVNPEWQEVLKQIIKYNGVNYHSETKVKYAHNPIWKLIYRVFVRPVLKKKYGKKAVKDKYDRKYF